MKDIQVVAVVRERLNKGLPLQFEHIEPLLGIATQGARLAQQVRKYDMCSPSTKAMQIAVVKDLASELLEDVGL